MSNNKIVPKNDETPPSKPPKTPKNKAIAVAADDDVSIDINGVKLTPTKLPPVTLRLNTLENSRKSLSGLMRHYKNGHIDTEHFRSLIGAFNVLQVYWKMIEELKIVERLTLLEEKANMKEAKIGLPFED